MISTSPVDNLWENLLTNLKIVVRFNHSTNRRDDRIAMTQKAAAISQEVLACIGVGLFAFGIWQVYQPACWMFVGAVASAPFLFSLRRP